MSTSQRTQINEHGLIDTTPLPDSIPKVEEVGATSAPLLSAAYFIGARCKDYNEDFMLCKHEAGGKGEVECLREGRKVTRCASSVLADIKKHCAEEFRAHWDCLENNNHKLFSCRAKENPYNSCVLKYLNLEKVVPGASK